MYLCIVLRIPLLFHVSVICNQKSFISAGSMIAILGYPFVLDSHLPCPYLTPMH